MYPEKYAHGPDRAMRLRQNKDHRNALRAITVAIAIISIGWLLSTIQPIPLQSSTVQTVDAHGYGTYQQ